MKSEGVFYDYLGRRLKPGDYVVWGSGGSASAVRLCTGRIKTVTDKYVTAAGASEKAVTIRSPCNLLLITDLPENRKKEIDEAYSR